MILKKSQQTRQQKDEKLPSMQIFNNEFASVNKLKTRSSYSVKFSSVQAYIGACALFKMNFTIKAVKNNGADRIAEMRRLTSFQGRIMMPICFLVVQAVSRFHYNAGCI